MNKLFLPMSLSVSLFQKEFTLKRESDAAAGEGIVPAPYVDVV